MAEFLEGAESVLCQVVQLCTLLLEFFGVGVLLYNSVKALVNWIRRVPGQRLALARGIALALEILMVGEALRSVVVRDWRELGILGGIIVVRVALTVVIHWEIKNEKQELEEEDK